MREKTLVWALTASLAMAGLSCSKEQSSKTTAEPSKVGEAKQAAKAEDGDEGTKPAAVKADPPEKKSEEKSEALASAKLGSPAPAFELKDLEGNTVKLEQFAGKTVVLEWFNPGCPFVQKSHTKGSLVNTAEQAAKDGVVWLAINSGAPGKQGHGVEPNKEAVDTFSMKHPVLVDEDGKVGKAYGAERTPHMFVIDDKGVLVYRGAIDNSPDGEGASASDGKLVNYVTQALSELAAGKSVSVSETEAYGCSVKYAG